MVISSSSKMLEQNRFLTHGNGVEDLQSELVTRFQFAGAGCLNNAGSEVDIIGQVQLVGLFCTGTLGIQCKGLVGYVAGRREIETSGGNFKIKGLEREIRVEDTAGVESRYPEPSPWY